MTVAVVTINQRHLLLFLLILAHLKEQSYQTFIFLSWHGSIDQDQESSRYWF
jgi:hypothetical protein